MVDAPLKPTTTAEQDLAAASKRDELALVKLGQRRVNIIWEITQAVIAVVTVCGTLMIAGVLVLRGDTSAQTAFLLLSNAFFMIVTAYFQRTNHTKIGGVPSQQDQNTR